MSSVVVRKERVRKRRDSGAKLEALYKVEETSDFPNLNLVKVVHGVSIILD